MVSEFFIRGEIERLVGLFPSAWTIGVTDSPFLRRVQHGTPSQWHDWNADSEQTARNIEAEFIRKGMKGGTGGPGRADYVYIFR